MMSILIASMGRPHLAATLASLENVRIPPGETIEIIVADDSADASAARLVAGLKTALAIRVVAVAAGNVAVARNACLDAARGEWLVFVDDDETVEPGWLEGHLSAARDFAADAVFGPVYPIYPEGTPSWFVAANPLFQDWRWRENGRAIAKGRTGNTLMKRAALGDLRFDPAFGRSGGEDDAFFLRLAATGARMVVTDRARAHERVPPERATPGYALRRAERTGQIYARLRLRDRSRAAALGFLAASAAKWLVGHAASLMLRPFDPARAFRLRMRATNNLGKIKGVFGAKTLLAWGLMAEPHEGAREAVIDANRPPLILHISSDYLDPIRPPPITHAVVRLVDRMTDHRQIVVSLQRVNWPSRVAWRDFGLVDGRRLVVYRYFAPPLGVGMALLQARVARRIRRFLQAEGLAPDIVHAHRFTFEGIAGWRLARFFGAALFCSVRGEVDFKVLAAKPTYRPLFRRIARDAARIFYVSAWRRLEFERRVGVDPAKTAMLPNIVFNARPIIPQVAPAPVIVAAMSLRALDKKGLPDLLAGFAMAGAALEGIKLEIIGDGPPEAKARVNALIERRGLTGRVALRDFMAHEALLAHFTTALALAMPSRQETFGMVYLEALFAGIPILYTAGTGIDGYLDDLNVGPRVEIGDVARIAEGLITLARDNDALRRSIRDHAGALYERFAPDAVLARYRAAVAQACVNKTPSTGF